MLSWIARLAARYDLAACDFLAWLNGDQAVDVWRMQRRDWVAYDALDRRLAFAAGIDLSQVETLRVPPSVGPEIEKWTRGFGVWCLDCVREDIVCQGETAIRAVWKLGFGVTCAVHGGLLTDRCGLCGGRQCGFVPIRGRLRLLCRRCRQLADQAPPRDAILDGRAGPLGVRRSASVARLVAALQADLWATLAASPLVPTTSRSTRLAADLGEVVRELGAAFLSPTWLPADGLWRPEDLDGDFTSMSVEAAFDALGLVAAVLPEVFSSTDIRRASAWWPGVASREEVIGVNLASLISGLSGQVLTALECSAAGWVAASRCDGDSRRGDDGP